MDSKRVKYDDLLLGNIIVSPHDSWMEDGWLYIRNHVWNRSKSSRIDNLENITKENSGKLLYEALDKLHISQKEIAQLIDVNQKSVSRYTYGEHMPEVSKCKKILEYIVEKNSIIELGVYQLLGDNIEILEHICDLLYEREDDRVVSFCEELKIMEEESKDEEEFRKYISQLSDAELVWLVQNKELIQNMNYFEDVDFMKRIDICDDELNFPDNIYFPKEGRHLNQAIRYFSCSLKKMSKILIVIQESSVWKNLLK